MNCCSGDCKTDLLPYITHQEEESFQHAEDMKCVDRNSGSLLKKVTADERKLRKRMMNNFRSQVGPAWFQELSKSQIAAADALFIAVSDETESCQYQRCRDVLSNIGLCPLPKKRDIVAAIRLSRNNDLAFLWFLYESVYPCDEIVSRKYFSLNERLILSSICHLDMMTTLRELDRILPKPSIRTITEVTLKPKKRVTYECPYDEPVPIPKVQPERFYRPPRRQHPKFELYQNYKDPFFVIQNETNRWYADERLLPSEGKNIAKQLICDQINRIGEDHDLNLNGLCTKHREEASKFNQLLKKALNKPSEVELNDYDSFERGVIYGLLTELSETEKKFRDNIGKVENKAMMQTRLAQIAENASNLKYLHLCEKCNECVRSKELCCKDYKHSIDAKPNEKIETSNHENQIKFFHRPSSASPFEFDYEKIFATTFLNDCGVVRNSINIALDLDKHLTEDNSITVCLQDMWNSQFTQWNEKHQREWEERQQRVVADCDKIGKNKRKIFQLLSEAIALMRKNPKYVLASLPNADRLTILKEWILQRFGIRYDIKDIEKRWKINKVHRDRLDLAGGPVPNFKVPEFTILGIKKLNIPLDEALKLKKKRDAWVRNYYKRLATGSIDKHQLSWMTMEAYMCNTERMREIFYAYMPARDRDFDRVVMNRYF